MDSAVRCVANQTRTEVGNVCESPVQVRAGRVTEAADLDTCSDPRFHISARRMVILTVCRQRGFCVIWTPGNTLNGYTIGTYNCARLLSNRAAFGVETDHLALEHIKF
jgi:hypothetical protein